MKYVSCFKKISLYMKLKKDKYDVYKAYLKHLWIDVENTLQL